MNAYEIIKKKRDGEQLSSNEIAYFVEGFTKGSIPDYQMSALLMAIFLKGMQPKEAFELTKIILDSGDQIEFDKTTPYKVDKHSTGGVGDKISIILAPLVATFDLFIPMISGRSLGHTGGTLDKLESIPGFQTRLPIKDFKKIVEEIGVAIIGQTERLAPADKKIYSLRDVTCTIESIPLITSSILGKKLSSGIDGLVLDLKIGGGAFMKNAAQGKILAKLMKRVMNRFKKDTVCVLTNMDEPLGLNIGNSLEIIECIDVLKGRGPSDTVDLTLELGAHMLKMAKLQANSGKAKSMLKKNLDNGKAYEKLKEMVRLQGGNENAIEDTKLLGRAARIEAIPSKRGGFLAKIDCEKLGFALARLGAGRQKVDDRIDHTVGLILNKKVGDKVTNGEPLAEVHYNDEGKFFGEEKSILDCFTVSKNLPRKKKLILDIIN